jgi:hypothetical protein
MQCFLVKLERFSTLDVDNSENREIEVVKKRLIINKWLTQGQYSRSR